MATPETRHEVAELQSPGRHGAAQRDFAGRDFARTLAAESAGRESTRAERDAALAAMLTFNRLMMARLGGVTAGEWLRVDLSSAQIKLLFWLAFAGEQPMSHVARALGIGMPAATSLVDKLVDHGLAAREHSPLDRRVVLVRATDEGHALAARLRQISEDEWRRIFERIPDTSLPALREAIDVLTAALQEAGTEGSRTTQPEIVCPQL